MKKYIILIITLIVSLELSAQTNNVGQIELGANRSYNHQIGLSVGMNTGKMKDTNFSPLHYAEQGGSYKLFYENSKATSKNIFFTNLAFSNGSLKTVASDSLEARYIYGDIEVGYLRKLNSKSEKLDFALGAKYHLDFNEAIFNNVFESFTFNIAHRLDLSARINYRINRRQNLTANISVPIVSLLVRPPYIGYDDELDANQEKPLTLITNGDFVSGLKHAALKFDLMHRYEINNRLNTIVHYEFNIQSNDEFKQFQNQLTVGLNYKF